MLVAARLSGVWHRARAHRFFSHARWSVDELGLRIAVLIIERLIEPGAPVLAAVDDALLHRRERKIHAVGSSLCLREQSPPQGVSVPRHE
jgi:hypothetical protein